MFKGNIGARTGRNVLEGKEIHCDSAGFDNFEDYFTDSASSSQEKTPETVRQTSIKSFLNSEKSVQDGDSPLSKLASKKRLSFKADATSDSDSSSITSFTPRNRLISKRGMQSFPEDEDEDEDDEKRNLEQLSLHPVTVKTYSPSNKSFILHSPSKKEYSKRISKRGMKSFPDDDDDEDDVCEILTNDDDDGTVDDITTTPDYLSPQPIVRQKMIEVPQQNLPSEENKEDKGSPRKIQIAENIERLSQKSSSSPSIIVMPKPREKASKNMPVQKWYIWEDNSLNDGAKIIITPYGVHEDTGVKEKFQNLGTNLQLIDEEESQLPSQKNWKPKRSSGGGRNVELSGASSEEEPQEKTKSSNEKPAKTQRQSKKLSPRKSDGKQTLKQPDGLPFSKISTLVKNSLPKPPNKLEDEVVFTDMTMTTDDESQKFKSQQKKILTPKLRVSPRRQKTYQRTKSLSIGQRRSSPVKRNLEPTNRKSLPAIEMRKNTTSSPRIKQAITVSKKKPSPAQSKKSSVPSKRKISRLSGKAPPPPLPQEKQEYKSVNRRNLKRRASRSPEIKVPAKRHKVNSKPTTRTSNYNIRSSASKPKKENISNDKKQKADEAKTNSEQRLSVSSSHKILTPPRMSPSKTPEEQRLSVSPSYKILTPPRMSPSKTPEDVPAANSSLSQSKTENSEGILLGFDSPRSSLRHKEKAINNKGSNKLNSSTNSNNRIDILGVFDSRELNSKLDKTNEKNKKISSNAKSNAEDGPINALQKLVQKKRSSTTPVILPRTRRRSGPLSSEDSIMLFNKEEQRSGHLSEEDSLVAFSQGYSKRISAEKSKSQTKANPISSKIFYDNKKTFPNDTCIGKIRFKNVWFQAPNYDKKHLKKAGGYTGRNIVYVSIKMRTTAPKNLNNTNHQASSKKSRQEKEDLNVSNFNAYEDPPDWLCLNCNGSIPQCLMSCIFCGFRRPESCEEDSYESESDSQEETTHWQCQGCDALIPISLEACIFCSLIKQEGSQGKNKKHSPQTLKEKPQKGKKSVGGTSKPDSAVIQKSMKSSFSLKNSYTFKSYTDIKVDHKISYCVCSESDAAMVGIMKLQKGGYRNPNWSLKEMFFTVLEGKVKVQIDNDKRYLGIRDTFVVAKNGEYSIENATSRISSLIFTIIK